MLRSDRFVAYKQFFGTPRQVGDAETCSALLIDGFVASYVEWFMNLACPRQSPTTADSALAFCMIN